MRRLEQRAVVGHQTQDAARLHDGDRDALVDVDHERRGQVLRDRRVRDPRIALQPTLGRARVEREDVRAGAIRGDAQYL